MAFQKRRATKKKTKLRMAIDGPPGSGKTYTALLMAKLLIGEPLKLPDDVPSRITVLDTERNSAELYADQFSFEVIEMPPGMHSPQKFREALLQAEMDSDVVILDSISHEWAWCLKEVDRLANSKFRGNSWSAWSEVRPPHDDFVDAMMMSSAHLIATMRAAPATVQEKDDKGKTVVRKLGLEAKQDAMLEFAFGVVLHMDVDNVGRVGKTRCSALKGREFILPGKDLAEVISAWLNSGDASADVVLTLEQAVEVAVQAITAHPGDEGKEARLAAIGAFKQWCGARRLPESDLQAGIEEIKAKVAALQAERAAKVLAAKQASAEAIRPEPDSPPVAA